MKMNDEEYVYKTIEELEERAGIAANASFRAGWDIARIKNKHLKAIMAIVNSGEDEGINNEDV